MGIHGPDSVVIAAFISAVAGIIAAVLAYRNRRSLDTGNGHTIGQAVARLEDMAWKHESRLDAVEVQIQEGRKEIEVVRKLTDAHLIEITPMVGEFKAMREDWIEKKP